MQTLNSETVALVGAVDTHLTLRPRHAAGPLDPHHLAYDGAAFALIALRAPRGRRR
jgi:hypothetical protein